MDHWGRARTWRQSLADHLEKEHGPLPDLVATLGSNLITAPPTPTVSSSIAGPDQDFVCKLHRKLTAAAVGPGPRCMQTSAGNDRAQGACSDSDESDAAPWSLEDYAERLFRGARRKAAQCEAQTVITSSRPAKRSYEGESVVLARHHKRRRHTRPTEPIGERPRRNPDRTRSERKERPQHPPTPLLEDSLTYPDADAQRLDSKREVTHAFSTPPSSTESHTPPAGTPRQYSEQGQSARCVLPEHG